MILREDFPIYDKENNWLIELPFVKQINFVCILSKIHGFRLFQKFFDIY